MKFTGVVLAGSRTSGDPLAAQFGSELKALIPVAGEPMVRRPVRALLNSPNIGDVIVLAQAPEAIAAVLTNDPRLKVRTSDRTIASTILALCADRSTRWPLLITTADHALLDVDMVDEFCAAAARVDIGLAVVERRPLLRRLPNTTRTWLKFRGGAYTGANLFTLRSPAVAPAIELWRAVEQDRKKGWRMLSLLGPITVFGAALRLLTIDTALARAGRRLGLTIAPVRLGNPIAGVDVDKIEDHVLAEAILEGRA